MSKSSNIERIVNDVKQDYERRREARRNLEAQWQLNINFYMGNQYSYIKPNNSVVDSEKQYFWQEKEVFNHIAPTIETRLSKLVQLTPEVSVLPASTNDADVHSAKLSKEIINSVTERINLKNIVKVATTWSEICGTSFYKILWNDDKGLVFAQNDKEKSIKLGDIDLVVCSPFEIFPDNLSCESIDNVRSIIHAKAVDVNVIKSIYEVSVAPEKCYSFSLDSGFNSVGGLGYDSSINKLTNMEVDNSCILIERYTRPSADLPNGKLEIVAGNKLLYNGDLPYAIGENGNRDLPFIKQVSCYVPGSFFGSSVIDRLIPIQRAYNAVRNRKHEFFNRVSMGVLTVESGSVDTDALEQDGLSPGKVLVYRQGSKTPEIMETPNVNTNFTDEENRLLDEFKTISGVNDFMKNDFTTFTNLSASALQLLMEQDEQRLKPTIDELQSALIRISIDILRLYKQFAIVPRILKIAGENGDVKLYYWDQNEINSDDVIFDTTKTFGETTASKRSMLLDLISSGLMFDEEGKFSHNMRKRCLDLLGFGMWENTTDLQSLHINKAQEENILAENENIEVLEIDEHQTHINEHIAYIIGSEIKKKTNKIKLQEKLIQHINEHKKYINN